MGCKGLPLPWSPLAFTFHPAQTGLGVSERVEPEKDCMERIRKWPLGIGDQCTGRWPVEVPLQVTCLSKDTDVSEGDGPGPVGRSTGRGSVRAIKGLKSQKEGCNVSAEEKPRRASWRKWYLV